MPVRPKLKMCRDVEQRRVSQALVGGRYSLTTILACFIRLWFEEISMVAKKGR